MPTVLDPQNPVHFVPNALIPTELDRTKVNYGLAQEIADGPSTQVVGRIVAPPASGVQVSGPIAARSGVQNVGALVTPSVSAVQTSKLAPPAASGVQSTGGLVYAASGVQQLGRYVYHPEAGCSPEVPA